MAEGPISAAGYSFAAYLMTMRTLAKLVEIGRLTPDQAKEIIDEALQVAEETAAKNPSDPGSADVRRVLQMTLDAFPVRRRPDAT
jgi:polyhydroxyalkanoate synthesis regulator phasin